MRSIRSATLVGYPETARAVGLDPDKMLASVGLDMHCMEDSETQIPLDAFFQLLGDSARLANCPDFGTRASIRRGIPDYGAVSLLMREAETVEQAINYYTTHLPLHADGTYIHLDNRPENPLITVDISARTQEEAFQVTQFAVVGITMQIRWLIDNNFEPGMASFSYPTPHSARPLLQFFNCPVLYRQAVSGVVLPRNVLQRPPVTSTPLLRKIALRHLEPILNRPPTRFTLKVDRFIRSKLDEDVCDAQTVAEHFKIDRRTLNRRLALERETFSSILQRVRIEIVCRALNGSNYSLSSIADEAGFKSLSSFSRWFQQSFNCTASDWRAQHASRGLGVRLHPHQRPLNENSQAERRF